MASTRSPLIAAGPASADGRAISVGRPERLLTAREVADWLGVSARWVLAHAAGFNRPVLPSVKLGKAVQFERTVVQEFIRECARFTRQRAV